MNVSITENIHLLLHLVAAVEAGEIHNQPQLTACILHILLFKTPLLGPSGPCQALIQIQQAIQGTCHCNHSPPSCLGQLKAYIMVKSNFLSADEI